MVQICGVPNIFTLIILIVFFMGPAILRVLGAKPGGTQNEGQGTDEERPIPVKRYPATVSTEANGERPYPADADFGNRVLVPSFKPKPAPSRTSVPRARRAVTVFSAPSDAQTAQRTGDSIPDSRSSYRRPGTQVPTGKSSEPIIALMLDQDPLVNGMIYSVVLGKPKGLEKFD
jgi:hypothetical protein